MNVITQPESKQIELEKPETIQALELLLIKCNLRDIEDEARENMLINFFKIYDFLNNHKENL